MSEELKPCPFCGGNAAIGRIGHQWDTDPCYIVCDGCNAVFEITVHESSKPHIIAAWNHRAEPDGLPEWLREKISKEIDRLWVKYNNATHIEPHDHIGRLRIEADKLRWVLALKRREE